MSDESQASGVTASSTTAQQPGEGGASEQGGQFGSTDIRPTDPMTGSDAPSIEGVETASDLGGEADPALLSGGGASPTPSVSPLENPIEQTDGGALRQQHVSPGTNTAMLRTTVTQGLKRGASLVAATTAAMMVSSFIARGSPWAGLNAMATAIGAGGRRASDRFNRAQTPTGLGLLTGGLLAWGVLYEGALALSHRRSTLATGALSGLAGYAFDSVVLPGWVVPNFRRKMGVGGTIAKYATLGIASAAASRGGMQSSPSADAHIA